MIKRLRGLTLIEAIISIFLLVAGFLIVSRCFHSALQISANVNARSLAVAVAERHLDTIKAWSRCYHHPRGSNDITTWDTQFSSTYQPDNYDDRFQVATAFSYPTFYSPCTRFEKAVEAAPAAGPLEVPRVAHELPDTRAQVTAVVKWGSSESLRLTTMICHPSQDIAHRRPAGLARRQQSAERGFLTASGFNLFFLLGGLSTESILPFAVPPPPGPAGPNFFCANPGGPVTLHHDETLTVVSTYKVGGSGIHVPSRCHFSIVGSGTGTIVPSRDGLSANFTHYYEDEGIVSYADNSIVQIQISTAYRGKIVRVLSPEITLVP